MTDPRSAHRSRSLAAAGAVVLGAVAAALGSPMIVVLDPTIHAVLHVILVVVSALAGGAVGRGVGERGALAVMGRFALLVWAVGSAVLIGTTALFLAYSDDPSRGSIVFPVTIMLVPVVVVSLLVGGVMSLVTLAIDARRNRAG